MITCVRVVAIVACVLGFEMPAAAQAVAAAGPAFGEEANGLRLALEVSPVSWKAGDAIEFTCTVKNVSENPVRVAAWGLDLGRALEVTDAKGNVLPHDGGRNATRRTPPDAFPTIAPGESKRFTLSGRVTDEKMLIVNELLGGIWHWSLADGDYTVRAVFDRPEADDWMKRQAAGPYWTGQAFSTPVKVTVGQRAAQTPEAAGDLKLSVTAEKTELKMQPDGSIEPTKLTFTFTNVSDKPLKLNTYDWVWSLVKLDVRGPDAESVQAVRMPQVARMMAAPTEKDFPILKPGESWTGPWQPTFPGGFGGVSYRLTKPGEYRLTATYTCTEQRRRMRLAADCWVGSVPSNPVTLTVVREAGR